MFIIINYDKLLDLSSKLFISSGSPGPEGRNGPRGYPGRQGVPGLYGEKG